jgi:hypothetical protein
VSAPSQRSPALIALASILGWASVSAAPRNSDGWEIWLTSPQFSNVTSSLEFDGPLEESIGGTQALLVGTNGNIAFSTDDSLWRVVPLPERKYATEPDPLAGPASFTAGWQTFHYGKTLAGPSRLTAVVPDVSPTAYRVSQGRMRVPAGSPQGFTDWQSVTDARSSGFATGARIVGAGAFTVVFNPGDSGSSFGSGIMNPAYRWYQSSAWSDDTAVYLGFLSDGTGQRGQVITTTDGTTFRSASEFLINDTTRNPGLFASIIRHEDGRFLAFTGSAQGAKVSTSTDGILWQTRVVPWNITDATFFKGSYYAAVSAPSSQGITILRSATGADWDSIAIVPGDIAPLFLRASPKHLVLAGNTTSFLSQDGTTWRTTSDRFHPSQSIVWAGDRFYSTGKQSPYPLISSTDGILWRRDTSLVAGKIRPLFAAHRGVVTNGQVFRSAQGTWDSCVNPPSGNTSEISWAFGAFWLRADNGTVHRSPDGKTWTPTLYERALGTDSILVTKPVNRDSLIVQTTSGTRGFALPSWIGEIWWYNPVILGNRLYFQGQDTARVLVLDLSDPTSRDSLDLRFFQDPNLVFPGSICSDRTVRLVADEQERKLFAVRCGHIATYTPSLGGSVEESEQNALHTSRTINRDRIWTIVANDSLVLGMGNSFAYTRRRSTATVPVANGASPSRLSGRPTLRWQAGRLETDVEMPQGTRLSVHTLDGALVQQAIWNGSSMPLQGPRDRILIWTLQGRDVHATGRILTR